VSDQTTTTIPNTTQVILPAAATAELHQTADQVSGTTQAIPLPILPPDVFAIPAGTAKAMSEAALSDANAEISRLNVALTYAAGDLEALTRASAPDAVARLRAVLRDVQFGGPKMQHPSHQLVGTCPACGAAQPDGHKPDCRIAAELRA